MDSEHQYRALVEFPGPDLRDGHLRVLIPVQHIQDRPTFGRESAPTVGASSAAAAATPPAAAGAGSGSRGTDRSAGTPRPHRPAASRRSNAVGQRLLGRVAVSSALSDKLSKSACAFPMISNAAFVRARSASRRSLRRRNRSISAASALRRRPSPTGLLRVPRAVNAPASRAARHSRMCE